MTAITIPNTFLPSTTISSTAMNQNFTEVADAIEASLALDGTETMTGVIRMANGTAGAPALTFGSDTNLGIYRKTTDELAFTTAGVLAAHFDAAGKMWIATDLDIADDLDIGGDVTIDGVLSALGTIELGNASDTTLSRASAGVVAVEGVNLLRAGQNLADVSVAATAFTNIKQAASDTATGVIEIAVQSEMEAASSTTLAVTPGRQHNHPGHPKFWLRAAGGGSPSLTESYNVTSITDSGTGLLDITIATDFSTATWADFATFNTGAIDMGVFSSNKLAGSVRVRSGRFSDGTSFDPDEWRVQGFGDQ
jgi:hypothetical protein